MKILFTKAFSKEELSELSPYLEVLSVDFIHTIKNKSEDILQQTKGFSNFIVSSQKAAKYAVELRLNGNYFCVGEKSKNILSPHFSVISHQPTAVALAQEIIKNHPHKEFCFLCSQIRLDTLPQQLTENQISFKEVVIYHTENSTPTLQNDFEVYVFFSPSGVKSFFKKYNVSNKALIFAIGNTTQNAVNSFTNQQVLSPDEPNLKNLIHLINNTINAKK